MSHKPITLSQALEGFFLAANARRLSPNTLIDYDNTFRKFEAYLGHDPPLAAITPDHIRGFLQSHPHLSAKTLCNYHTGLSSLWTWATKEGIVEHHIVRAVDAPRPEQRDIIPYTCSDIKAMLAACDRTVAYARPGKRRCDNARDTALRDRAIITLLVDTGIRSTELCHLRLSHADLKNHRIVVEGKGRKERMLPISSRTSQVIWRYLAARDDTNRSSAHLFITRSRRPLTRQGLRRLLNRIGQRAGITGVTTHRFRHTFAISFMRNGGQIFALQRMLGHSTLDMVQRYVSIAQADIEQAHLEASPVANWLL